MSGGEGVRAGRPHPAVGAGRRPACGTVRSGPRRPRGMRPRGCAPGARRGRRGTGARPSRCQNTIRSPVAGSEQPHELDGVRRVLTADVHHQGLGPGPHHLRGAVLGRGPRPAPPRARPWRSARRPGRAPPDRWPRPSARRARSGPAGRRRPDLAARAAVLERSSAYADASSRWHALSPARSTTGSATRAADRRSHEGGVPLQGVARVDPGEHPAHRRVVTVPGRGDQGVRVRRHLGVGVGVEDLGLRRRRRRPGRGQCGARGLARCDAVEREAAHGQQSREVLGRVAAVGPGRVLAGAQPVPAVPGAQGRGRHTEPPGDRRDGESGLRLLAHGRLRNQPAAPTSMGAMARFCPSADAVASRRAPESRQHLAGGHDRKRSDLLGRGSGRRVRTLPGSLRVNHQETPSESVGSSALTHFWRGSKLVSSSPLQRRRIA